MPDQTQMHLTFSFNQPKQFSFSCFFLPEGTPTWRPFSRDAERSKKAAPSPLGTAFLPRYRSLVSSSCFSASSSSSRRLSRATRTASTTKAENVQSLPRMVSSTSDITSTGKRMLLGSVAGILGILNFRIGFTSIIGLCGNVHFSNFLGEMSLE